MAVLNEEKSQKEIPELKNTSIDVNTVDGFKSRLDVTGKNY